jgi:hypothetical protein
LFSGNVLFSLDNLLSPEGTCIFQKRISNFFNFFFSPLTRAECQQLIQETENLGYEPITWEYEKSYRDCERVLVKSEKISEKLWQRILANLNKEDIENVRPYGFFNEGRRGGRREGEGGGRREEGEGRQKGEGREKEGGGRREGGRREGEGRVEEGKGGRREEENLSMHLQK